MTSNTKDRPVALAGIDRLYVGQENDSTLATTTAVDAETLWGQVDLQNEALRKLLMSQDQKLASTDVADIKLQDLDQVIPHDAHQCEDDELKHDDESEDDTKEENEESEDRPDHRGYKTIIGRQQKNMRTKLTRISILKRNEFVPECACLVLVLSLHQLARFFQL